MDEPFFSSPMKRPHFQYDREPIETNARQKRHQSSREGSLTPRFFPDEVLFRLLCPTSKTGSVIGKGGSIVKMIRHDTGAKITVSDAVPGADERVIIISAQERDLDRAGGLEEENDVEEREIEVIDLVYQGKGSGKKHENGGKAHTSPAQEALFRVHARIIDDERENDLVADEDHGTTSITTRLLVPSNQVGCLLGRGGKIIEQMREESGAQIRILPRDQLPVCALVSDEVVQLFGEANAVRKALRLISSRLLENTPRDRYQSSSNSSVGEALSKHNSFYGQARSPPGFNSSSRAESCVDRIGSIIGRGGSIIQNLREETGAKIKVEELISGADERVVVVSAAEHTEDNLSPAQEAVFHIQDRIKDIGPNQDGIVTTRLLVPSNQVGCLLGKGGVIIAEMRRSSKASIRILGREHLPKCAHELDEVVQIVGDIHVARDALVQITSRLRANLCRDKALPSVGLGLPNGHGSSFENGNSSPDSWTLQRGRERDYSSVEEGHSHHRGSGGFGRFTGGIVTSTTVEVIIPSEAVTFILGTNGSNMAQIRQISGAKVKLYDARDGASESTVEISGTPDQTHAAQGLLQAFILNGQS
ncbi:hypothetical protein O6H91_09G107100 [Diphasiastrum complanatum]|uniref:Uncharacterized protein n=1 Tax=Diphasiastrum complanatum TaxID=34168 RepID=A0ACC2CT68_DIPCM|nr:hypothetical protein O6H91_09G107100 [Diphasiastrum complanatum]